MLWKNRVGSDQGLFDKEDSQDPFKNHVCHKDEYSMRIPCSFRLQFIPPLFELVLSHAYLLGDGHRFLVWRYSSQGCQCRRLVSPYSITTILYVFVDDLNLSRLVLEVRFSTALMMQ